MNIALALREAIATAGWSPTKLAAEAGVREVSAMTWLQGTSSPKSETLELLRVRLPGLASILDAQAREEYRRAA